MEVPSVTHWFQESERVWNSAHQHLQCAVRHHKHHADVKRATTPTFHPQQKEWALPLGYPTKTSSCKSGVLDSLVPSPSSVKSIRSCMNSSSLHSTEFTPTFHVSLLKPYHSPVSPCLHRAWLLDEPPLPIVLEYGMVYSVNEILSSPTSWGIWWTGRGMAPRKDHGSQEMTYSIPISWQSSTILIPKHPAPRGRGHPP